MNTYKVTEQSYKNGYNAGVKALAERLKEAPSVTNCEYEWLYNDIDTIAKKLTE
jgi:hypothetical protein